MCLPFDELHGFFEILEWLRIAAQDCLLSKRISKSDDGYLEILMRAGRSPMDNFCDWGWFEVWGRDLELRPTPTTPKGY
jgi:hypothetical protein